VPKRIADAEQAIVVRARQLFLTGSDTIEEDQALDDALYVADIRWAGASPAENACAAGIQLLIKVRVSFRGRNCIIDQPSLAIQLAGSLFFPYRWRVSPGRSLMKRSFASPATTARSNRKTREHFLAASFSIYSAGEYCFSHMSLRPS
jgi:hypothetical protein